MPKALESADVSIVLGFDWGMKRIGVAIGNKLLDEAKPLKTLSANAGVPEWSLIQKLIQEWRPDVLVVGIPTTIDGKDLYTTDLAKKFCEALTTRFNMPVHPVDERLTTVEARQQLFEQGGYRKIQNSEVDSYAAKLLVEQWFNII